MSDTEGKYGSRPSSGAKPPRVPGLLVQPLPAASGLDDPAAGSPLRGPAGGRAGGAGRGGGGGGKTTLFIDLSPRSRANANSPRVQNAAEPEWDAGSAASGVTRGSWASQPTAATVASSPAPSRRNSSAGNNHNNSNNRRDYDDDDVRGVGGGGVGGGEPARSPMRSRAPAAAALGTYEPDEKIADLPLSDVDSEWVPLREANGDYNAQLANCYEGLRALEVRCGCVLSGVSVLLMDDSGTQPLQYYHRHETMKTKTT
jgi:hypothetical protein